MKRSWVRARVGVLSFPCPERQYDFGKGWSADTDFFPYLPINHNGTFQFVVDRASLRKQLNRRLQVTGATRPTYQRRVSEFVE